MSKALIIKGADFSTNKVATITFGTVPCTAIALDESTLNMAIGVTETLTATLTPSNTTDTLSWASSDDTVASVVDGVVTAVALGAAVITATCGQQTATCAVAIVGNMADGYKVSGYGLAGTGTQSSGNGQIYPDANTKQGLIACETGTLGLAKMTSADPKLYPYIFPAGTTKVIITITDSNITPYRFYFFNSATSAQGASSIVKGIQRIGSSGMVHDGNKYSFDIPSYDGEPAIDSICASFVKTTDFTDADFNSITFEFVKE